MTADELETEINALRTAALAIAADGSTVNGNGTALAEVVATSTRKYLVSALEGAGAQQRLVRDFARNHPPLHPGATIVGRADGVILVAESDDDLVVCARIRKA